MGMVGGSAGRWAGWEMGVCGVGQMGEGGERWVRGDMDVD